MYCGGTPLARKRAKHVEVLAVSLYVAVNLLGEGRAALISRLGYADQCSTGR